MHRPRFKPKPSEEHCDCFDSSVLRLYFSARKVKVKGQNVRNN